MNTTVLLISVASATLAGAPLPAAASDEPASWTSDLAYTADVTAVVDGGSDRTARYLDNLLLNIDGDLSRAAGWRGARLHLSILANGGGQPNDAAGTLQGVNNIEVDRQTVRLYELWIEQSFAGGNASLLAGLYDLNSEFYATEASDLLISPSFGIGSELAATGPNGPSIFPSTALAIRLRAGGDTGLYAQGAVVNARAGALGDRDGVDTSLDDGALWIGETGWNGPVRLAAGGWRYDREQADIRDRAPSGEPARSRAKGAYLLAEAELFGGREGPRGRAFARIGISDGDTTDFEGGWQAGLRFDRPIASRPDSAFSVGVHRGALSPKARANARVTGVEPAGGEEGLEITWSDRIGPVTVQPDLQIVRSPGGDREADPVVVAAIRLSIALD